MRRLGLIILVSAVAIILVVMIAMSPREIDWSPSYSMGHKRPLGCYILHDELVQRMPALYDLWKPYDHLQVDDSPNVPFNMVIIDGDLQFADSQANMLVNMASKGCNIFLSGGSLSSNMADTLGILVKDDFSLSLDELLKVKLSIRDSSGVLNEYSFGNDMDSKYVELRSDSVRVLSLNSSGRPVFVGRSIGSGTVWYHCKPEVFTNYHLLSAHNYKYAFGCLSVLPNSPTYWDEVSKSVNRGASSSMAFINRHPLVKQGWYLMWIVVGLYMLLELRRRQRAIPVIKSDADTGMEFVGTLARLYYLKGNHLDIANKKYLYFKEYVKRNFYISLDEVTDEKIEMLSDKSGVSAKILRHIADMGGRLALMTSLSESELVRFNQSIEFFYQHDR